MAFGSEALDQCPSRNQIVPTMSQDKAWSGFFPIEPSGRTPAIDDVLIPAFREILSRRYNQAVPILRTHNNKCKVINVCLF